MKNIVATPRRRNILLGALGAFLLLAGIAGFYLATRGAASPTAVQGPSASAVDTQVCSHVSPAPYLWGPAGDWKLPAVAALAEGASPLVRDAYFAAASAPLPESSNWSETFPPFQRAMNGLANVCSAVR